MIKIEGFEHTITRFSLMKEVNRHSECEFEFTFCGQTNEILGKVGKEINIDDENRRLFSGYIAEISARRINNTNYGVCVKARSDSQRELDTKAQNRIFQNPDKTLKSIAEYVAEKSGFRIECTTNSVLPNAELQCDESDFAFLNRLAASRGSAVFVCDVEKKVVIAEKLKGAGSFAKFVTDKAGNENAALPSDMCCKVIDGKGRLIELTYYKSLADLGYEARYNGKDGYYVSRVEVFLANATYHYKYTLREHIPEYKFSVTERAALKAKVVSVDKSGNIEVDFRDEKFTDADNKKRALIPFAAAYVSNKGGIFFLPDSGDSVEVIYSRGTLTAHELFGEVSINDTSEKTILFDGKSITLGKNGVEIKTDKVTIKIDKDFALKAGGKLDLNADGSVHIHGSQIYLK